MDGLADPLQHPGDRVLGQQVDLHPGVQRPQLSRDRHVAAHVAEADREGQVENPVRTSVADVPGDLRAGDTVDPVHEVADRVVDPLWVPRGRQVSDAVNGEQLGVRDRLSGT